jgi:two-component system sensor histidine kinase KdpD
MRLLARWLPSFAALGASLVATALYNYFFIPPIHTFYVRDLRNWIALMAFLVSLLIVTRLVVAAREQAAEAERRRLELEANSHIEALRESDALKTSLLRAVSHDLTTPLTAIRIQIESLKRHAADAPELLKAVQAIDDESSRLHRRIDNLLTMGRLEAGIFTPRPEPTPPADIFRSVRESLPLVFAVRQVKVSVDPDCPDAFVDPSLVLEVMVNLVENAHRASSASAIVEMAATSVDSRVRLEVLDRGPGLGPNADVARRGLGLEIARSLAAASGGTFELVNRDGGGAIARVDLPAAVLTAVQEIAPVEETD